MPTADDFELATVQLPEPADGQDLVRNLRHERGPLHARVAAYAGGGMRGWLHTWVNARHAVRCGPVATRRWPGIKRGLAQTRKRCILSGLLVWNSTSGLIG